MIDRVITLLVLCVALISTIPTHADVLYVASGSGDKILKVLPDGTSSIFANSGVSSVLGLAFDRQGNLYAANFADSTITKFSSDGIPTIFATSGMDHPEGLAFDQSSQLYVANFVGSTITRLSPNGIPTVIDRGIGCSGGLAFDKSGNLYVTSCGGTVQRIAPDCTFAVFATGLKYPIGLAFDKTGNLYTGNYGDGTITKIAPDGTAMPFGDHVLKNPYGLAFDSYGDLYVADIGNGTIERFDCNGHYLGIFANVAASFIAFDPSSQPAISIVIQPQSQTSYWGRAVTMSVAVTNASQPVSYQWSKNLAPILDATNATLVLTNLQPTDAGNYAVVVSDGTGRSLTSDAATLTVSAAGTAIALYAGVTIDGVAGQTYGVQSTLDLSNTNSWVGRANVTLTNATQLWYDSQPATQPQTYYRVVPGPIPTP